MWSRISAVLLVGLGLVVAATSIVHGVPAGTVVLAAVVPLAARRFQVRLIAEGDQLVVRNVLSKGMRNTADDICDRLNAWLAPGA